jgi:hypothetical protein
MRNYMQNLFVAAVVEFVVGSLPCFNWFWRQATFIYLLTYLLTNFLALLAEHLGSSSGSRIELPGGGFIDLPGIETPPEQDEQIFHSDIFQGNKYERKKVFFLLKKNHRIVLLTVVAAILKSNQASTCERDYQLLYNDRDL